MQARSVEFAKKFGVVFEVRNSMNNNPGTIVQEETSAMESLAVRGVSIERNQARVTVSGITAPVAYTAIILSALSDAEINVDMIVANTAHDGQARQSFTMNMSDLGAANNTLITETENSFSFFVDINNFEELTKIVPFLADPNFEVYGPLYNQGMTEEEYLDMIYYLLGEEGPDAIKNGEVKVNIEVPGTISSVEGAVKTGDRKAEFKFPIIDFLLLNKPISFKVSWN